MALAIESDDDRAAFMDVDAFGDEITYRQNGLDVGSFAALFERTSATAQGEFGASMLHSVASLTCRDIDLPDDAGDGDVVVVRSQSYTVRAIEPDGTGMSVLRLEKA